MDDAKISLRDEFLMMLRKLPPGRHVQYNPSRFQFLHIQFEPVVIERDKQVHLGFGAADALIRDVQLIARMPALDERGILAIAEHAISGSFETLAIIAPMEFTPCPDAPTIFRDIRGIA